MSKDNIHRTDRNSWGKIDRYTTGLFDAGTWLWEVFVYSSLHIAVIAVIEVAIATILLGLEPNPALLVVGLVTFAVYANDRIADVETDAHSNPQQASFVRQHQNLLYLLGAVAYGLAVMLAVLGGVVALILTLLPGAFWVLYATSWLDGLSNTVNRLKEVILVNTAIVALAWTVTVTFLPIAFASGPAPLETGIVFVYFFLRDFVHTEVPNIPDRESDAKINVDTIPSAYGLFATRRALYIINLLTLVLISVAAVWGYFEPVYAAGLFLALGYSFGVTALIGRWDHEDALARLIEYEYPFIFLLLFVMYLI